MPTELIGPSSLLAAFLAIAEEQPSRPMLTFVDRNGRDEHTLTFGDACAQAGTVAHGLRSRGLRPGESAVLVYPPSLEFVTAFLGCMAAGVVPVAVYPPNPLRPGAGVEGLIRVVADCEARAVLTTSAYQRMRTAGTLTQLSTRHTPDWPKVPWHRTDRMSGAAAATDWHQPASPDEVAFLQYTSGSTSTPKGVMISHGNLGAELEANAADLGLGAASRGVSWVPQYHDLGLISVILSTVIGHGHTRLISPLSFLRRPEIWFSTMARVGATHTAAPNFALDLAVQRTTAEQRAGWDLSSLEVLMTTAEPSRPATIRRFFDAFAVTGLRRETLYGAYGLAEHTVSVTMGGRSIRRFQRDALQQRIAVPADPSLPAARVQELHSVGRPSAGKKGLRVRVVDPDTRRSCPPGVVGEIWVDSPTKALGYLGMPEEAEHTFRARIVDVEDGDTRSYLRTGDLGFCYEGEYFLTGRHKDVIIIRGRNILPEDVEDAVRTSHPLIRPGGVAAFGVDEDSQEHVAVFVEIKDARRTASHLRDEIFLAARAAVTAAQQIDVHTLVIGDRGLVRKTTSGKLRRGACREALLRGAEAWGEHGSIRRAAERQDGLS
ncbi:fatty acyl-AMP ligase [Streptomyces zaomyceticus]|uniref:fatty acyl-AMP ligase n=1 Tax=Streptomyces zaomyceticus TaxID=68286 RepID=UPI003694574C